MIEKDKGMCGSCLKSDVCGIKEQVGYAYQQIREVNVMKEEDRSFFKGSRFSVYSHFDDMHRLY